MSGQDLPFWSDDFDMDFPKVFPDAKAMLGDLVSVVLYTPGHAHLGRLNHPTAWNGHDTMLAFFGFRGPDVPPGYSCHGDRIVRCTAWEAFRDAWAHNYRIHVQQVPVWDTFALRGQFEAIMHHVRGRHLDGGAARRAKIEAMASYARAIERFGEIVRDRAPGIVVREAA